MVRQTGTSPRCYMQIEEVIDESEGVRGGVSGAVVHIW